MSVINIDDCAEVVQYLNRLDRNQIKQLGGLLGLDPFRVNNMTNLPHDMVIAWLNQQDSVMAKCGDILTWEVLAKALRRMGQNGVAGLIDKERCRGTPQPRPSLKYSNQALREGTPGGELDQEIDPDGIPRHIGQIAKKMNQWDGQIADGLGITEPERTAIRREANFDLQKRKALLKWKERCDHPTYRALIEIFKNAGRKDLAKEVTKLLNISEDIVYTAPDPPPKPSRNQQPLTKAQPQLDDRDQSTSQVLPTRRQQSLDKNHERQKPTGQGKKCSLPNWAYFMIIIISGIIVAVAVQPFVLEKTESTQETISGSHGQCSREAKSINSQEDRVIGPKVSLEDRPTLPQLKQFKLSEQGRTTTKNILQEIGFKYNDFGDLLLEDEQGTKVSAIKHQHRNEPDQDTAINRDIVIKWLDGNGKQPITWETFIDVLDAIGKKQLAKDMRKTIESGLLVN